MPDLAENLPAGLTQVPYAVEVEGHTQYLTIKQRLFVYHYLADPEHRANHAANAAGYSHANRMAWSLLQTPSVRAAIEAKLDTLITGREVLERLADHARGDITWLDECYSPDAEGHRRIDLKKVRQLGIGCLIKTIRPGAHGDTVELYDASKALELLGRFHKLFTDRLDVGTDIDFDKLSDDDLERLARRKLK